MIEFLRSFGVFGGIAMLVLNLIFILFVMLSLIRWLHYRKFKSDRVKPGDIVHNLTDNTKSVVSCVGSAGEMSVKEWANIPRKIPPYLESTINQIQDDKIEKVIVKKSPFDGIDLEKSENDAKEHHRKVNAIMDKMSFEEKFKTEFNARFGGLAIVDDISEHTSINLHNMVDSKQVKAWIDQWISNHGDLDDNFKRNANSFLESQFKRQL